MKTAKIWVATIGLLWCTTGQASYKHTAEVQASRNGLAPALYVAIIEVESKWDEHAYNNKTHDYGLAQVNLYTARAFDLDIVRLRTDPDYNLYAGALILADLKRRYAKREPTTWVCRYNVGTKPLIGLRLQLCAAYLVKVNLAIKEH